MPRPRLFCGAARRFLFGSRTDATHDNSLTGAFAIGFSLGQIHFIDFSVKRSAADAELFRGGGLAPK
jgi:hypothetical protein